MASCESPEAMPPFSTPDVFPRIFCRIWVCLSRNKLLGRAVLRRVHTGCVCALTQIGIWVKTEFRT